MLVIAACFLLFGGKLVFKAVICPLLSCFVLWLVLGSVVGVKGLNGFKMGLGL